MSQKFNHDDDELLIDNVRAYPCLYDHEHKDFKDYQIRENVWKEISDVLVKSSEDCKSRWKNIRHNYLKQKRKQKQGTGSAASRLPKWPLFKQLQFLELVKTNRSRIQNFGGDSDSDNNSVENGSDSESQPTTNNNSERTESPDFNESNPKKLRCDVQGKSPSTTCPKAVTASTSTPKARILHNIDERSKHRLQILSELKDKKEEDDVDLFMRSIALMVKKLPPRSISEAKLQILTLVTNLQLSTGGKE